MNAFGKTSLITRPSSSLTFVNGSLIYLQAIPESERERERDSSSVTLVQFNYITPYDFTLRRRMVWRQIYIYKCVDYIIDDERNRGHSVPIQRCRSRRNPSSNWSFIYNYTANLSEVSKKKLHTERSGDRIEEIRYCILECICQHDLTKDGGEPYYRKSEVWKEQLLQIGRILGGLGMLNLAPNAPFFLLFPDLGKFYFLELLGILVIVERTLLISSLSYSRNRVQARSPQ